MVGGPRMVEENFDGEAFVSLRSKSPAESAIDMARGEDIFILLLLVIH